MLFSKACRVVKDGKRSNCKQQINKYLTLFVLHVECGSMWHNGPVTLYPSDRVGVAIAISVNWMVGQLDTEL